MHGGAVDRIVRIIARLNIGGPAIHATLLTAGLDTGRFRSVLVSGHVSPDEGDMGYFAHERGVRPVYMNGFGRDIGLRQDAGAFVTLTRLLASMQPSIVHTHTAKAGTLGRAAATLLGVRVIVHTFHGHVFRGYFDAARTRAIVRIERALAKRSSCIIAISERMRDEITNEFQIAETGKVRVIRLGFELDALMNGASERGCFRRVLGIGKCPLIGIVGRLVPIKNHELFLDAASEVLQGLPDAHFAVVGDGPLKAQLEQRVAELGLGGRVHFVGWQRKMIEVYSDLDVLVLTSRNEGTPVTLIEAQACQVPVVSTNVGGVRDTIIDGTTGWLVSEEKTEIALRVIQSVHDESFQRSVHDSSREFVLRHFSSERLLRDVKSLYIELLDSS